MDRLNRKVFLIIGHTGAGKSHFVQNMTNDESVKISAEKDSCTEECKVFHNKDGLKFIDTPGIKDTHAGKKEKSDSEVYLGIVKFLFKEQIKPEDLFIIRLQSDNIKNTKNIIEQFAYIYFLYQEFGYSLSHKELERLINEYN